MYYYIVASWNNSTRCQQIKRGVSFDICNGGETPILADVPKARVAVQFNEFRSGGDAPLDAEDPAGQRGQRHGDGPNEQGGTADAVLGTEAENANHDDGNARHRHKPAAPVEDGEDEPREDVPVEQHRCLGVREEAHEESGGESHPEGPMTANGGSGGSTSTGSTTSTCFLTLTSFFVLCICGDGSAAMREERGDLRYGFITNQLQRNRSGGSEIRADLRMRGVDRSIDPEVKGLWGYIDDLELVVDYTIKLALNSIIKTSQSRIAFLLESASGEIKDNAMSLLTVSIDTKACSVHAFATKCANHRYGTPRRARRRASRAHDDYRMQNAMLAGPNAGGCSPVQELLHEEVCDALERRAVHGRAGLQRCRLRAVAAHTTASAQATRSCAGCIPSAPPLLRHRHHQPPDPHLPEAALSPPRRCLYSLQGLNLLLAADKNILEG
ncbi:B1065G12.27 [Oryza sativa Japonica Group]|uniref:B1065G12.27 protein n=1 Tax=Oryza sativa subsp. japonica TaxID=39947 RepID=Q8RZ68_ORYSJ|nr:B1065G12.27 [Oryza sativa Japonica Group]